MLPYILKESLPAVDVFLSGYPAWLINIHLLPATVQVVPIYDSQVDSLPAYQTRGLQRAGKERVHLLTAVIEDLFQTAADV